MQQEEHTSSDPTPAAAVAGESVSHHNTLGIIGVVGVLLIVAVGGGYLWYRTPASLPEPAKEVPPDSVVEMLSHQHSSDELEYIQKDLDAVDFSEIDADFEVAARAFQQQ